MAALPCMPSSSGEHHEAIQPNRGIKEAVCRPDKTISSEAGPRGELLADRQAMNDLIAQVKRISDIVEELSCREHAVKR